MGIAAIAHSKGTPLWNTPDETGSSQHISHINRPQCCCTCYTDLGRQLHSRGFLLSIFIYGSSLPLSNPPTMPYMQTSSLPTCARSLHKDPSECTHECTTERDVFGRVSAGIRRRRPTICGDYGDRCTFSSGHRVFEKNVVPRVYSLRSQQSDGTNRFRVRERP